MANFDGIGYRVVCPACNGSCQHAHGLPKGCTECNATGYISIERWMQQGHYKTPAQTEKMLERQREAHNNVLKGWVAKQGMPHAVTTTPADQPDPWLERIRQEDQNNPSKESE